MQEQQFDARGMMERAGEVSRELSRSDKFPIVVGAVAGGVAGAVMAFVIASRVARRVPLAHVEKGVAAIAREEANKGWSAREVVQLVTIGATLLQQAQAWIQDRRRERETL